MMGLIWRGSRGLDVLLPQEYEYWLWHLLPFGWVIVRAAREGT